MVEVTSQTITSVLGRTVWEAYIRYFHGSTGLNVEAIPTHLKIFFSSIKESFGVGGDVLVRTIVRRLYAKFSIEITITEDRPMEDYVEELKARYLKGQLQPSGAKKSDVKNGEQAI